MQPVFTQPTLSSFTSKPLYLAPWKRKCLHFIVLSPDLTLYYAFCCLYTIFFQLWFPKKKKSLVAWSFLSDLYDQK